MGLCMLWTRQFVGSEMCSSWMEHSGADKQCWGSVQWKWNRGNRYHNAADKLLRCEECHESSASSSSIVTSRCSCDHGLFCVGTIARKLINPKPSSAGFGLPLVLGFVYISDWPWALNPHSRYFVYDLPRKNYEDFLVPAASFSVMYKNLIHWMWFCWSVTQEPLP